MLMPVISHVETVIALQREQPSLHACMQAACAGTMHPATFCQRTCELTRTSA